MIEKRTSKQTSSPVCTAKTTQSKIKKYRSKHTLQLLEHAASARSAPCDEVLNLERSTGIPLGRKNASHQRYKTAGKLSRKPCKSDWQSTATLIWLLKKCWKEGQILLPSRLNPDFGDYHSRSTSAAIPPVKTRPFCQRTEQGHISFFLNHGQGRWRYEYKMVRDPFGIWEIPVSLPHLLERSPANLSCILRTWGLPTGAFSTSPIGTAPLCREHYQISWPGSTRRTTML